MSDNFFAQETDENEEFRDIPDEVDQKDAPIPQIRQQRPVSQPQQVVQQPITQDHEESPELDVFQEEEDFTSVLSDARLRLEQGRLYEMIMNHNLFENTDADEKAVKHVQRQIRNFAKEQMEIMLGMRQEASKAQAITAADFPFNDLEVQTLRALASAATKGATATPEAQQFSGVQPAPRQTGLSPIGSAKPTQRIAPVAPKQAPRTPQRPLTQKAAVPVKRTRNEAEIENILAEEGISREEYERQYDPNYKPLTKPPSQLSEAELKERARQLALKNPGQVKNPAALPMPSAEQEEMLHTQRAHAAASHPQMQSIMSLLLNQKK